MKEIEKHFMPHTIRIIWMAAVAVTFGSVTWYTLASTAGFQRGIDLMMTAVYVLVVVPALCFIGVSILLLKKAWLPGNAVLQVLLIIAVVILASAFSFGLIHQVKTNGYTSGWLRERVRSDVPQVTSDGKYEYWVEHINLFQRNSFARLYVANVATGDDFTVVLDARAEDIRRWEVSIPKSSDEKLEDYACSKLEPTDVDNMYLLTVIKSGARGDMFFEVDVMSETARRTDSVGIGE